MNDNALSIVMGLYVLITVLLITSVIMLSSITSAMIRITEEITKVSNLLTELFK